MRPKGTLPARFGPTQVDVESPAAGFDSVGFPACSSLWSLFRLSMIRIHLGRGGPGEPKLSVHGARAVVAVPRYGARRLSSSSPFLLPALIGFNALPHHTRSLPHAAHPPTPARRRLAHPFPCRRRDPPPLCRDAVARAASPLALARDGRERHRHGGRRGCRADGHRHRLRRGKGAQRSPAPLCQRSSR